MAHYGEILNTFDPLKDNFCSYINKYFNFPNFKKIKDINENSIYMVKINCLLSNKYRYLIAIVLKDINNIGSFIKLSDLNLISFQTRTLDDKHNIESHNYQPLMSGPLTAKIKRTDILPELSKYKCDKFPIEILLLHKKKDIQSEYQTNGNIISALETYETIINFI